MSSVTSPVQPNTRLARRPLSVQVDDNRSREADVLHADVGIRCNTSEVVRVRICTNDSGHCPDLFDKQDQRPKGSDRRRTMSPMTGAVERIVIGNRRIGTSIVLE